MTSALGLINSKGNKSTVMPNQNNKDINLMLPSSSGTLALEGGSGGGVLLNELVANNSPALIDTTSFNSKNGIYTLQFEHITPAEAKATLCLQFYGDGVLLENSYDYVLLAGSTGGNTNSIYIPLTLWQARISQDAGNCLFGSLNIYDYSDKGYFLMSDWNVTYSAEDQVKTEFISYCLGRAKYKNAAQLTGIKIFMCVENTTDPINIADGRVKIFGSP